MEAKDAQRFEKLGCGSILSLAIIAPVGYEDHTLKEHVTPEHPQIIDATVENVLRTPKTLQVTLYAHNLGHRVDAVYFRPKPYMVRQFTAGERNYYYGKLQYVSGHVQVTHPNRVSSIGGIVAKYKTVLRADVIRNLVRKYVTMDALQAEGLSESMAGELMQLHFPTDQAPYASQSMMSQQMRRTLKFAELYDYMRSLYSKRRYFEPLQSLEGEWRSWAKQLPFTLTDEQVHAIEAIESDLRKEVAARRMVVGDVGSGKTMVILASALMARPHRSILMAPTTILANQLFEEAQKHLPQLKSVLVTNKTKKLDLNEYDFIIGTHALLYRELPEAPLVMVDEQHRFGTAQRNRLQALVGERKKHPHFLQFSATPIPRTQAMIDSAQIDVSLITKTPFKKNIETRIIGKSDFASLMTHIKEELSQNHQVLIVYPLVEQSDALRYQSIEEARGFWESRFENVYVTHGKDKEKEAVLVEFRGNGTILLATTVVEVGISLPRLSTVVIVGAERLGLSTLHQLRGRVSRTGLQGYCYLFTHQSKTERLEAFSTCANGFDIAALDLKYRQSGDLLSGKQQSGKQFVWVDLGEDEAVVKEVKTALKKA